jgi:transglutaminase-like putative cysteine protease
VHFLSYQFRLDCAICMRSAFLFLFIGCCLHLSGQVPAFGPAPKWVQPVSAEGAHISQMSEVQMGTEYTLLDEQYHLGTRESYSHSVQRLVDQTAVQSGSRISIELDPTYQQLTFHQLRIVRAGKVIEKYRADHVQVMHREEGMDEFLYDGRLTVVIDLEDVRPGDVLEQAYTLKGWSPSFGDRFHAHVIWNWGVPVGKQALRFVVPPGRTTRFFSKLGAPELVRSQVGGNAEFNLVATDVKSITDVENAPSEHEVYPYIEVTEFADWEAVRQWAIDLFQVERAVPPPLNEKIARFNTWPQLSLRLDSAWALVRDEMRYLGTENGLSAYKPHDPEKVYAQRFGDCKDVSLLLVTLLRAVGAEAWPALVNTYNGRVLDSAVPKANAFNHCIVLVRAANETYWLDPTDNYARGSVKNHHISDHGWALVLDDQAIGLQRMPEEEAGSVETVERIDVKKVDGEADLSVVSTYDGRLADQVRGQLATNGAAELSETYLKYYRTQFGEANTKLELSWEDDPVANRLVVQEHYHLTNPWKPLTDSVPENIRILISPGVLKEYLTVPTAPTREAPFALGRPVKVVERFELSMPQDWPVSGDSLVISGHGVDFSYKMGGSGRYSQVEYRYATSKRRVEAADYNDFKAQQKRIEDNLGREWTWNGAVVNAKREVHPHELMHWLVFFAVAIWLCKRIWRYDPEVTLITQPGLPIGGWLVLPTFGMVISVPLVIYALFRNDMAMLFYTERLPDMSKGGSFLAHFYVYYSQLMAAFQIVYFPMIVVLIFKRRTSIPLLMACTYVGLIADIVVDAVIYSLLDLKSLYGAYSYGDLSRGVIGACVWLPYFLVSDRVKRTFVQRLHSTGQPSDRIISVPLPEDNGIAEALPPPAESTSEEGTVPV